MDNSPVKKNDDKTLAILVEVMDYLPVGICVTDEQLHVVAINSTAKKLMELPDALFENGPTRFEDIIHFNALRGEYGSGDPEILTKIMMDRARLRESHGFERKRPNGTVFEVKGEPLPKGGQVGLWLDITKRSQAEERLADRNAELEYMNEELCSTQQQLIQSEKMASIGQLAAGVAHEINNPIGFVASNLGTFSTYVESLMQIANAAALVAKNLPEGDDKTLLTQALAQADIEWLKEDIFSLLAESKDGIERVKKIVQDLKDFSRPESPEMNFQLVDMVKCIRSTASIARNEVKYCADVIDLLPDQLEVECLPSSLNQVFLNLLVNAAHAIESKGSSRGLITMRASIINECAHFEIEDSGSGMNPEILSKIFDPFFTTKPVGKGTGLGLSIAHGIVVEKHGGKIFAESELGKGTTFTIEIPLRHNRANLASPS